ncbi:MAG: radical SAM protein, partial [Ignavibacteriae bacterium]|nr:radical SAM protein [Ignavibacteriota bacterium]
NIVFMGMGEPFWNYKNVISAIKILNSENGLNIAARKISVSTCGIIPGIEKFTEENLQINLAISLHAPSDALRSRLMPINKKYPLNEILHALAYYYSKTKIRITFEYILFRGMNDRDEDAEKLIKLSKRIPSKMNIIPFHAITFYSEKERILKLRPSSGKRIDEFVEILRQQNVTVFVRSSAGEDIDAACGQLAVRHERKSKRETLIQAHNINVA